MRQVRRLSRELRTLPPIVQAALIAAAIIGGLQAWRGGRTRAAVVGAGHIARLRSADAPAELRYDLDVVRHEPVAETVRRVEEQIATWPDVIILGVSTPSDRPEASIAALARLTRGAENAAAEVVLIGFHAAESGKHLAHLQRGFRELCTAKTRRLCVEPSHDVAAFRVAVGRAAKVALQRHRARRESLYR